MLNSQYITKTTLHLWFPDNGWAGELSFKNPDFTQPDYLYIKPCSDSQLLEYIDDLSKFRKQLIQELEKDLNLCLSYPVEINSTSVWHTFSVQQLTR